MAVGGGARNRVRIIGGECRGRLIDFPDGDGLRPTGDRVRETLFNWLQPIIAGARCLDLFAGSGALGLEAASRGAAQVAMIEKSSKVAQRLRRNIDLLGLGDRVQLIREDALVWLDGPPSSYDVVFVDPPFADGLVPQLLDRLSRGGWLRRGGYVYLEQDRGRALAAVPEGWRVAREGKAGQVVYRLLRSGSTAVEHGDQ